MQKKKSQRTPRTTTERMFSSNLTTPGMSFAAALRVKTEERQQPQTHQVAGSATMEPRFPLALPQHEQQTTGQSVWATNVNSLPLYKMLSVVVTVVQQIMTEFNGAVLVEVKIVVIKKNCLKSYGENWTLKFVSVICCTKPVLTKALYIFYIHLITGKM
jgi:hypothetical protein